MGNKFRQFTLLLWKNFLIQKRKIFTTILEIGLPTFFALILIFIRLRVKGELKSNETWTACERWNVLDASLPKKVAFYPNNSAMIRVMSSLRDSIQTLQPDPYGFDAEQDMVDYLMFANKTVNNTASYLGGVVFTSPFTEDGEHFRTDDVAFTLRLSSFPRNAGSSGSALNPFKGDKSWNTDFMFPVFQRVGPREQSECGGTPGYVREGFMVLQHAINMAVMKEFTGGNTTGFDEVDVMLRRHPYPAYNDDNFVLVIQQQFPLILMLSFVLVALNIVKDVVHEKERKLKESMKMMGLSSWLHWLAWFVKYFLFLFITVAVMTLFLSIKTDKGRVIGNTSPTVVLVFLVLYSIATISFCFAVSVFFSKANSGAAAGGILFFITYIPYFFLQPRYQTMTWIQKLLSSLISNVAMAYGGQIIGMFEGTGAGVQWSTLTQGASVDDTFTMFDVMVMLLADALLYGLITWYIEAVFPGEYGVPQRWYFLFTPSYWCGTKPTDDIPLDKSIAMGQNPQYFESDPVGLRAGIQIRNLRKEFKNGSVKKVAVCGMSLDLYEGQITALLGHNGAGKTTTMSMLTGFMPVTNGTAYVNGYDIRNDIASVRDSLGLCPQHDILFDTLTVEEHLTFFAKLKGCPSKEVPHAVEEMLTSVNLQAKRKELSKTLSGGMKRKLSVGIALIAGSKIVILDEPSSGMDPDARRQMWTVLQQHRAGRTMVLTTHFMDEADVLGDRIAIMAEGVVKCCGSSLFLKNKYGAGYHMVIVKDFDCDIDAITSTIQKYVPQAKLENNVGAELSFILPHESSDKFEGLFTELEDRKSVLGISSYGASVTTMEEVFLRVGESGGFVSGSSMKRTVSVNGVDHDSAASAIHQTEEETSPLLGSTRAGQEELVAGYESTQNGILPGYHRSPSFTHTVEKNFGIALYFQQFWAMFIKRALHTMRNKVVTVTQLAIPLFFTIVALIVVKTFPGPHDSPKLNLTVSGFGDNVVVYELQPNTSVSAERLTHLYGSQFLDPGTQVMLVNNQTGKLSSLNMTNFLLEQADKGIGQFDLKYMVGAEFNPVTNTTMNATAYFNNQGFHSPAISMAALANALLRYFTNNTSLFLSASNHPLPRTNTERLNDELTSDTTGFNVAFNIVFGMAFLASSFTLFLVKERAIKSKHVQFVSGVKMYTFWVATFCWDMVNFLVPCICLLITLKAFDIEAYVVKDHLFHIFLLFFLYGWAMLPFMYLWSFLFTVPSTGFVWLTMFNILSGVATILAVGILSIPQLNLLDLSRALEWAFLVILPNFCLGQGLEDYFSNYNFLQLCTPFIQELCPFAPNPCCAYTTGDCGDFGCVYFNENMLSWESKGIGRMLIFLTLQGFMYFSLLFALESQLLHTAWQRLMSLGKAKMVHRYMSSDSVLVQEDEDVARERARLANSSVDELLVNDKLILSELTKFYGSHLAVNEISVGIPQGECFGLLGINGAGKTTIFKMLTGDELVSSGNAYLDGLSIQHSMDIVRQRLGYCPQFDALIDQMTGRETLYMYARLRGVKQRHIPGVVDDLLTALLLTEHADKLVKAYSGGNKRKLSTAIALIGNPPVIFLDEPTTGMDPLARRFLWDTLCSIRASGRTLILTSHSMEECEALCTRLAIMVNGQFKCLGSQQHLKNKFGEGFTLLARCGAPDSGGVPDPQPLLNFIEEKFPGSIRKDVHQGNVHYHITDTGLKWGEVFGIMERAKATFNIEDYSVSQTTLEQVFINFARAQVPPREEELGCCSRVCFSCAPCSSCCRSHESDSYHHSTTETTTVVL